MEINNASEFRDHITDLAEEMDDDNHYVLDEYLRSLLSLIYRHKDDKPTYLLFYRMLKESFETDPQPFNREWMKLDKLPYTDFEPHPDDSDNMLFNPETRESVSKFEVLEKTLIFQLALLKRIHEGTAVSPEEAEDPEDVWFNDDVLSFLRATVNGISDYTETECDWLTLADMMEYGRTYSEYE